MGYKIITDSCANLTDELIESLDLIVVSLVLNVDNEQHYSYVKGEKTDLKRFYTMMRQKKNITTSQVNSDAFLQVFEEVLKAGEDVLFIAFSSALSGTCHAAQIAVDELKEKYPERKLLVVDTLSASMGEGLLTYYAVQKHLQGESIEEVYQWLMDNRLRLCHWFTVEDLFFLHRGGRVSSTSAVLGTMLGIKPVMHVDDEGRLILVSKARGRRKSLDELVERMKQTVQNPGDQMIFISHGDCIEDAEYVAEQIKAAMPVKDVVINYVDPVIGSHSGPGTIALFFLGSHR